MTVDVMLAYVAPVWQDPAFRSYDELIDLRLVDDVDVPSDQLHEVAQYSRQYDNPETPARTAVIASEGLVFGLSRMFSTVRSLEPDDNREFQVFVDFDEGRAWLDELNDKRKDERSL
ncbi:MAG: hypothetical protein ACI9BW_004147 [Gammaproteobacteria bacterium]|jgi:hypothetical protein